MEVPLQVTFRGMRPSPALRADVVAHAEKLAEFQRRITRIRVVIAAPHRHHRHGRLFRVGVELAVPGDVLASARSPTADHAHEDPSVAVRDAFDAVRRRLQDATRVMRGDIKKHEETAEGLISKIWPERDYGFIDTTEGDEVYFHRNAVKGGGFDKLKVGGRVRLNTEIGANGYQATVVVPVRGRQRGAS
jgi:cold shock CspA family protein/ribosome-associated translation inhibitor RaiA